MSPKMDTHSFCNVSFFYKMPNIKLAISPAMHPRIFVINRAGFIAKFDACFLIE